MAKDQRIYVEMTTEMLQLLQDLKQLMQIVNHALLIEFDQWKARIEALEGLPRVQLAHPVGPHALAPDLRNYPRSDSSAATGS